LLLNFHGKMLIERTSKAQLDYYLQHFPALKVTIKPIFYWMLGLAATCIYCQPKVVQDDYVPALNVAALLDTLHTLAPDSIALRQFFNNWNRDIPPNKPAYICQNDTIQTLYDVFEAYFKEKAIDSSRRNISGGSKWHYLLHTDRYVLIPKFLFYAVVDLQDSLYEYPGAIMDTLAYFRPPIRGFENRCLYATPELSEALNTFLGHNDPDLRGKLFISEGDTALHQKYLRYQQRKIQVSKAIALYPKGKLDYLYLHPSLQKAQVHLQYMGSGSVATFVRSNEGWMFCSKHDTWIE
jgi:hypothetical protein